MGIDLSHLKLPGQQDRRSWHGSAFIVETMVLLAFLVATLAFLTQLVGAAHHRSTDGEDLSNAIVLASNDAESFAANPLKGSQTTLFTLENGVMTPVEQDNFTDSGFEVERTVTEQAQTAGVLYKAQIVVSKENATVYEIDTSYYVSNNSSKGAAQ